MRKNYLGLRTIEIEGTARAWIRLRDGSFVPIVVMESNNDFDAIAFMPTGDIKTIPRRSVIAVRHERLPLDDDFLALLNEKHVLGAE